MVLSSKRVFAYREKFDFCRFFGVDRNRGGKRGLSAIVAIAKSATDFREQKPELGVLVLIGQEAN